jgi:hypothetical protein
MLISRDIYEGIHSAEPANLPAIAKILAPLYSETGWKPVTTGSLEQNMKVHNLSLPIYIYYIYACVVVTSACLCQLLSDLCGSF